MNKFVVFPGNNPKVIKEALINRGNWEDVFILCLLYQIYI